MTASGELLSAVEFQGELRRAGRFCSPSPAGDPLVAVLNAVEQNPACVQSRVLTRVLAALTYQSGEFRRADVSALDTVALKLAIALMDAFVAGIPVREEWIRTADAASAAVAGA